jgi:hypothetical protein
MHLVVDIVAGVFGLVDMLVQWGFGWRYLFSPSFRRNVRVRQSSKSAFSRIREGIFITLCFLAVNSLLAVLLWRSLIGPIKSVHEWGT